MPDTAANRILIVDDEAAQMQALCDTLRERGYETTGFSSANAALAALDGSRFDLLLSDLMMPEMDGIALLQAARKHDPDMIGVIMTGQGTIETAVGAMKAGAFDYILKPFRMNTILPVLTRALDMRRLRLENAALELSVRERTAELEASIRELDAFTRSVSHDLRVPLRGICDYSKLLIQQTGSSLSPMDQSLLEYISASAERMGRLIDGLLNLSRSARAPLSVAPLQVSALVQEVLQELRRECADRDIRFEVGELLDCTADATLLRQVFVNLLTNAIKYTRPREHAQIEIGSRRDDAGTLYFVKDNGVGFDMQRAARLFGIFERLHSASEFEGTGIGLSIAQRIVQRHNGQIWAESATGSGATFYFTVPAEGTAQTVRH